jgi:RND family efflux transporter MFP subunit
MRMLIIRVPQRAITVAGLAAAAAIGCGIWLTQGASSAGAPDSTVKASRGNLVVSVGGVGQIVTSSGAATIEVPAGASATSGGSASGSASAAPADAVFPRASGHVARFLVKPGQHVSAGQAIAVLDDGGSSASAARQAELELAVARIELSQKRQSDPLKGPPPTPAEVAAARAGLASARADFTQALGRTHRADVAGARLDLRRAQADLEILLGGTRAARSRAISLANERTSVAQKRLGRVLAPASPTDISAAQADVKKAEADLAVLRKPPAAPAPEEITAAQTAVDVAEENLTSAQSATPPDPAAIGAAQVELDKAIAALATLRQPAAAPLPQETASAQAALDAARTKLATLQGPPDAAEVAAARQELALAQSEARTLRAGPSATGLRAARQAAASARAKLAQLRGPAPAATARSAVLRAQADLAVLLARRGPSSPSDIRLAQVKYSAAAERLASARLGRRQLTVRAPAAGTVTSLLTVPGAPADGSTPIASVTNLAHLAVRVQLSEFDVAQVKTGMKTRVSVDALGGETFPGAVIFVAPTGADNGGVVTFPVTVSLSDAEGAKPGMNASVRIIVAQKKNVVQVPLEAVSQNDQDEDVVSVVSSDGKASPRRVELGLANNKNVEIVQGLRAGERVGVVASSGSEE